MVEDQEETNKKKKLHKVEDQEETNKKKNIASSGIPGINRQKEEHYIKWKTRKKPTKRKNYIKWKTRKKPTKRRTLHKVEDQE